MIDALVEFIHQSVGAELTVFLTAILPFVEVRGAIPLGLGLGLPPFDTFISSVIGSMLPVPFILMGIRWTFRFLRQFRPWREVIDHITKRTLAKGDQVQKYGAWGLVLFVGIPLPGTGVWSGSLIAVLLRIPFRWALPAIFLGNVIAALAVLIVSQGIAAFF
jgi:uncharacterized membrane protein